MDDALTLHRFHLACTVTCLFRQLTMGLAFLIFVRKSFALKTEEERYNTAARFWIRIFASSLAMSEVMEIHRQLQFWSVVTASIVVARAGGWYLLLRRHETYARTFIRVALSAGLLAALLLLLPAGDRQGRNIARFQSITPAAMEGLFGTVEGAPITLLGQPDTEKMRLDNPLVVPTVLSFITYRRWYAEVEGLNSFPTKQWPGNIALLHDSFHIVVGLGTIVGLAVSTRAAEYGFQVGLAWWITGVVLVVSYFYLTHRRFSGKVVRESGGY